jgi:putative transposase
LLGISKKSYYYSHDPEESFENRYQELKKHITAIIKKDPGYGYRRIKKALEERYNIVINHKLLLKLLRMWSLLLKRRIRKPKRNWVHNVLDFLQLRANILWRMIKKSAIKSCFQVILSDVTEITYNGAKAYLCVHIDYFGKMIYGWKLSERQDRSIALDSFNKAVKKIRKIFSHFPEGIVFHQDRGSIYTSDDYISALLNKKCRVSFSRTGEPGDNAVNESFFSRLKEEWRDVFAEARTFEELKGFVRKAIDYYNNERYHSSIGLKSPVKFIQENIKYLTKSNALVVS